MYRLAKLQILSCEIFCSRAGNIDRVSVIKMKTDR
jgi:hypothetical protein